MLVSEVKVSSKTRVSPKAAGPMGENVVLSRQFTKKIRDAYGSGYDAAQILKRDDDVEIYYEVRGDGPPLCIVNNMYIVGPLWKNFTTKLVKSTRVITYDLRNQGASSQIASEFALADHVGDLLALLDALEIEQTYLLGTSISTLICRDFALAHPERVCGLVLLAPYFNFAETLGLSEHLSSSQIRKMGLRFLPSAQVPPPPLSRRAEAGPSD
jgi:pimeloyl-ACP methyl ester carboxylesterase